MSALRRRTRRQLGPATVLLAALACADCGAPRASSSSTGPTPANSRTLEQPPEELPRPIWVSAPRAQRASPTWQSASELAWPPPIEAVAFDPAGQRLAVGAGPGLWVVDLTTRTPRRLVDHTWVDAVQWTADGSAVRAIDHYYGTSRGAQVVNVTTGQLSDLPWPLTGRRPWSSAYSRDLSVYVASERSNVRAWTEAGGQQLATEAHRNSVHRLSATSTSAASTDGDELWLWSLTPLRRYAVIPLEASPVTQLVYSVDGSRLAAALRDGRVALIDVPAGALLATLAHPGRVSSVAFSADGRRLATSCTDGAARIWSIEAPTPEVLHTIPHEAPLQAVDLSLDGRLLATGGDDGRLRVFDGETGAERAEILVQPTEASVPDR